MRTKSDPLKKSHFRIEKFIQNPGFQHIALSIFKKLDPKSLGNCRVVSKEWKACIDEEKYWWHLQLVKCKEIMSLDRGYDRFGGDCSLENRLPEFMKTMDHIYEKESMANLKSFATFMSSYRTKLIKTQDISDWKPDAWETPLHFAVDQNRMDILDMLVNSPHMKDMNVDNFSDLDDVRGQRTLLGKACYNNQIELIKYFMDQNLKGEQKVDFNRIPPAPWGYSLFHNACDSNNIEVVKLFLDYADELGINLNARFREHFYDEGELIDEGLEEGRTPVMYVVKPEIMKLLLADERIDVNATDDEGHTAIYHLCDADFIWEWDDPDCNGRFELREVVDTTTLLMSPSSRFDPTIDERTGYSVLHSAVYAWSEIIEVILKYALAAGIDVNCRNDRGQTAAHGVFDSESLHWREIPSNLKLVLKYAKDVGIDLEARDNRGRTPLHHMCASKYNEKEAIEMFLKMAKKEFGIEFNLEATDEDGKTPFELCPE